MIEIVPNWHPIFVHFTIALVTMAALFYLIAKLRHPGDPQAEGAVAGRWALLAGALITLATIAAGFYAYNTVNHDSMSHAAMTDHRNWAVPTALVILALAVWAWIDGRKGRAPSWLFVIALLMTAGSLTIVGYKGAELVYRHGMGVMRLPAAEGEGHHHGTAGEHEHGSSSASSEQMEEQHDEGTGHPHEDETTRHDEGTASPHDHDDGNGAGHAH